MSSFHDNSGRIRKVLDEENYISLLENVIERNYFPHLATMEKQLEYLDNNEIFDISTLRTIYKEIFPALPLQKQSKDTVSHSFPSSSSSRGSLSERSDPEEKKVEAEKLTIPDFFNSYISEDNYSFLTVQERDLQKFRKKYHWIYEPSSSLQLTNGDEDLRRRRLALPTSTTSSTPSKAQRAGMLMLYYIDNKILSEEERKKLDDTLDGGEDNRIVGDNRPNNFLGNARDGSSHYNFHIRNSFMFYPSLKESEEVCQIRDPSTASAAASSSSSSLPSIEAYQRNPILPITNTSSALMIHDDPNRKNNDNNEKLVVSSIRDIPTDQFLIPSKPSSKVPSSSSSSSSLSSSYKSNQEKIIQRENVYQGGIEFMKEIDNYLRGKRDSSSLYSPSSSSAPTPLESPHSVSTITSIASSQPILFPYQSVEDRRQQKLGTLVSMSPMPVPGKGILFEPIMTWGKVIGQIIDLGSAKEQEALQKKGESSSSSSSLHSETFSSHLASSLDPSLPRFTFQPNRQREKLAHHLDTKNRLIKVKNEPGTKDKTPLLSSQGHSIFGDQYTPQRRSSTSASDSGRSRNGNSSIPESSRRMKLHEMSPAAQLIAQKVQNTLQRKIIG
jgi:hypothetical protein